MLNPSSPHYSELKIALDAEYQDDLENLDAIRLEINSRDFLARVAQTNAMIRLSAYSYGLRSRLISHPIRSTPVK